MILSKRYRAAVEARARDRAALYAPCPVPRCRAWINPRQRVLCLGHWQQLPRETRRQAEVLHARRKRSERYRTLWREALAWIAYYACPQRFYVRPAGTQLALWGES